MNKYVNIALIIFLLILVACSVREESGKAEPTLDPPRFAQNETWFDEIPFEVFLWHDDPWALIYYTLTDTVEHTMHHQYIDPIHLTQTTTINAYAMRTGYKKSSIVSATFTLHKVATPTFSLEQGIYYTEPDSLGIYTETANARIYYTINSFVPYENDFLLYTDPISLPLTNYHLVRVNARAFCENYMPSDLAVAYFEFKLPEMTFVPGGIFRGGFEYLVSISDFYIGNYEVSRSQWESTMSGNSNGISPTPNLSDGDTLSTSPNKPVSGISWYDTIVYCNLRSVAEGFEAVYSLNGITNTQQWGEVPTTADDLSWLSITADFTQNGYRLPTEMEWNYAARGGHIEEFYTYAGSFNINEVAWYRENAQNESQNLGTKKGNEYSLFDMSGNVWEWCWDWHSAELPRGTAINPTGPDSGSFKLLKGGSYLHYEMPSRISYRAGKAEPWYRMSDHGVRVVRGNIAD